MTAPASYSDSSEVARGAVVREAAAGGAGDCLGSMLGRVEGAAGFGGALVMGPGRPRPPVEGSAPAGVGGTVAAGGSVTAPGGGALGGSADGGPGSTVTGAGEGATTGVGDDVHGSDGGHSVHASDAPIARTATMALATMTLHFLRVPVISV
jgi:hypothetical protein